MSRDLQWDGSDIGSFSKSIIVGTEYFSKLMYVSLKIGDDLIHGILVQMQTTLPCLFDELKTVFGLPKTGSHRIKIGSKRYILYKASYISGEIVHDKGLKDDLINSYPELRAIVSRFLTFRSIVGVSPNLMKNIKIRQTSSHFVYPVSFNDKFTYDQKHGKYSEGKQSVTTAILKWFEYSSMKQHLLEMLNWNPDKIHDRSTELILELRSKINSVIQRVDPDFISLSQHIVVNICHIIEI